MSVHNRLLTLCAAAALAAAVGAAALPVAAQTLPEALEDLLKNHRRIKAAEADMAAAHEKAKEALGDWYPKLDITTSYGHERQYKGNKTEDTRIPPREAEAKITQLLWDFGSANASIERARLQFEQSRAALDTTLQAIMLESVVAYLDVMRRLKLLDFAKASEDNIKRQTELEDARVQRGSGFSTDVLQAKAQLAGANAARVRAEGALQNAINRYVAVFYKAPEKVEAMVQPRVPVDKLPTSLDAVIDNAVKGNPTLKGLRIAADLARADLTKTKADKFAPKINLVGEASHKNDFDGTIGQKHDQLIKVEMKYDFNLGFTAINTLKAAQSSVLAADQRHGDSRDTISEQAKNAWQELDTARRNAEALRNQANIASEFLELARKERALGRRSLIDVLAGETALINASSDAASAETDVAISVFRLLAVMGSLSLDDVK